MYFMINNKISKEKYGKNLAAIVYLRVKCWQLHGQITDFVFILQTFLEKKRDFYHIFHIAMLHKK